jgi:hypothetical protein
MYSAQPSVICNQPVKSRIRRKFQINLCNVESYYFLFSLVSVLCFGIRVPIETRKGKQSQNNLPIKYPTVELCRSAVHHDSH